MPQNPQVVVDDTLEFIEQGVDPDRAWELVHPGTKLYDLIHPITTAVVVGVLAVSMAASAMATPKCPRPEPTCPPQVVVDDGGKNVPTIPVCPRPEPTMPPQVVVDDSGLHSPGWWVAMLWRWSHIRLWH